MTIAATPNPAHFRALARQAVSLPGLLRGLGADSDWQREVKVVDLSLGGACLELADTVPADLPVALVIDTPHFWDPLTLTGAVRWARALPEPGGQRLLLGVCFEHASGVSLRALSELLEAEAFG